METPRLGDRRATPLEALRGVLFILSMFGLLAVMGLACAIPSWLNRNWAMIFIHAYCDAVLWLLRVIAGTRVQVTGQVPQGGCIVASKHESFMDIILLTGTLPRASFVMKKSIRWVPVLNIYAERLGSIAIDRSKGASAMRTILDGAEQSRDLGRQLIIFPQGTRVPPGEDYPYRFGVVKLYEQLGQPIVPAALNSGWFWPKKGVRRTPGVVTLTFLDPIPPGQPTEGLLDQISGRIEGAYGDLARDAAGQLGLDPTSQIAPQNTP